MLKRFRGRSNEIQKREFKRYVKKYEFDNDFILFCIIIDFCPFDHINNMNYEKRKNEWNEFVSKYISEVIKNTRSKRKLLRNIAISVKTAEDAFLLFEKYHPTPTILFEIIGRDHENIASDLIDMIIKHEETLQPFIHAIIYGLQQKKYTAAEHQKYKLSKADNPKVQQSLAEIYRWQTKYSDQDRKIIEELAKRRDDKIKVSLAYSIYNIINEDINFAVKIAIKLMCSKNIETIRIVCSQIEINQNFQWGTIEKRDIDKIYIILEKIPLIALKDHDVKSVIKKYHQSYPENIVNYIETKIDEIIRKRDAERLPIIEFEELIGDIHEFKQYKTILKKLRDLTLRKHYYWKSFGIDAFIAASNKTIQLSKDVLMEWCLAKDKRRIIMASSIIREFGHNEILSNIDLIDDLLSNAAKAGEDVKHEAKSEIVSGIIHGGRSRSPHQASPTQLEIIDKCNEILQTGISYETRQLLEKITEYIQQEINDDLRGDELRELGINH